MTIQELKKNIIDDIYYVLGRLTLNVIGNAIAHAIACARETDIDINSWKGRKLSDN